MLKYFTDKIDEINEVEIARCILQSQVAVHTAAIASIRVHRRDQALFEDIRKVLERKHIVEDLEHFIEDALKDGAITTTNAGCLLHPLHHEVHDCIAYINKRSEGIQDDKPLHEIGADITVHGHHLHIEHVHDPHYGEEKHDHPFYMEKPSQITDDIMCSEPSELAKNAE